MRCPACQHPVSRWDAPARFCPNCGAPIDGSTSGASGPSGDPLAPLRKVVWTIAALSILGGLGYRILSGGSPSSNEAVVDETETRRLDRSLKRVASRVDATRLEVARAEERVRAAKQDLTRVEKTLQSVQASDPRLSDDPDASIRRLQEAIEAARLEILREEEEPVPPSADVAPDPLEANREDEVPSWLLDAYRPSVVAVVSTALQVATGIVIERSASVHFVLTVADAAPHGTQVACLFRAGAAADEATFESVLATEVRRDERAGLLLLACRPSSRVGAPALSRDWLDGGYITTGDDVYAICAQLREDATFTSSIYDGVVSADPREVGGVRFLQTTLPVNPGSLGAPVVSSRGELIGLVRGKVPGLERQSLVLPSEELLPALEPMRLAMSQGHGSREMYVPPPGQDRAACESAARERPPPYDPDDAFDLPNPSSRHPEIYPGPKDLLLHWSPEENRVSAWKRGQRSPVWTKHFEGRARFAIAYRPWGARVLISAQASRQSPSVELDAARGRVLATIPPISGIGGETLGQAWSCFHLGDYRVLALRSGIGFVNVASAKGFRFGQRFRLLGHHEDLFTLMTDDGKLGWLTQSGTLAILARIEALLQAADEVRASKVPDARKHAEIRRLAAQIQLLTGEIENSVKLFETGEVARLAGYPQMSFCHIPGSYTHIVGPSVWKIGPDSLGSLGKLSPIRHSAADEAWFYAYYDPRAQPCPMASPDGRYAVTDTHVYGLQELKPLVELPFPTGPAGFTSSGTLIYAHDRLRHRVVFLQLEELLSTGPGPYGIDRGTEGEVEGR